eukprot:TRINITY_DN47126_c0_g1_i1.p1 TRINITY_DN47126_c0_g1~~TRINITY_DN47126_c0_g1_i1.p1  ORF type:complete len:205 (-),score=51.26 TRINITY_DN47126_c0_g1_i1:93-707(-)
MASGGCGGLFVRQLLSPWRAGPRRFPGTLPFYRRLVTTDANVASQSSSKTADSSSAAAHHVEAAADSAFGTSSTSKPSVAAAAPGDATDSPDGSSKTAQPKLGKKNVWDLLFPETTGKGKDGEGQSLASRMDFIGSMKFAAVVIVILELYRYSTGENKSEVKERELEEVRKLRAERQALREARAAASGTQLAAPPASTTPAGTE